MYFFETAIHRVDVSIRPIQRPSAVSRLKHSPDRSNHRRLSWIFTRLNPSLPPPPTLSLSFWWLVLFYPLFLSSLSGRFSSSLTRVLPPVSIERATREKSIGQVAGACTRSSSRGRGRTRKRHEEARDARRQGVSAFQLDSMANRSPTKGNRGSEGGGEPPFEPPGSLNISFHIPRNV